MSLCVPVLFTILHIKLFFSCNVLQGRFSSSASFDTLQGAATNVDKYVPTGLVL